MYKRDAPVLSFHIFSSLSLLYMLLMFARSSAVSLWPDVVRVSDNCDGVGTVLDSLDSFFLKVGCSSKSFLKWHIPSNTGWCFHPWEPTPAKVVIKKLYQSRGHAQHFWGGYVTWPPGKWQTKRRTWEKKLEVILWSVFTFSGMLNVFKSYLCPRDLENGCRLSGD